jgi:hypothetical protein
VTADDFRRIALGLDGAIESAHMGHPDFRVNGRIFATIHASHEAGMVALTPDDRDPPPFGWSRLMKTRLEKR